MTKREIYLFLFIYLTNLKFTHSQDIVDRFRDDVEFCVKSSVDFYDFIYLLKEKSMPLSPYVFSIYMRFIRSLKKIQKIEY